MKLFHTILCLLQVTRDNSDLHGQLYKDSIIEKNDDEEDVDVPKLNESKDWNNFKESFVLKIN